MRSLLPFVLLASIAPAAEPPARKPNVVVILADDLRADVLATYGGPVRTPNLDKLAARGVLFNRATCGYPICHVARGELLSGRCLVKEAASGKAVPFPAEWTLWPDAMRRAGWHTVHCGKWHVHGTPWTRGFAATSALFSAGGANGRPLTLPKSATGRDVTGYTGWTFKSDEDKPQVEYGVGLTPETDARIADGAVDAIRRSKPDRPLFLSVNFTAPHDPLHRPKGLERHYAAKDVKLPKNFRAEHPFDHGNLRGRDETIVPAPRTEDDVRAELAVYYALTENLDTQVGRIVDALKDRGELDRTLLLFTSDQGLAIGSHGLMGKQNQYDHTANVPLVMTGPGVPSGKRLDAQSALRDLFPTVCDLTGVPTPATVHGTSLLPVLHGRKDEVHDAIFGYFTDTQRMVRTADGWKLVWYPRADRVQLFHVAKDPEERNDLSTPAAQHDRIRQMKAAMLEWLRAREDPAAKE